MSPRAEPEGRPVEGKIRRPGRGLPGWDRRGFRRLEVLVHHQGIAVGRWMDLGTSWNRENRQLGMEILHCSCRRAD